MIIGLTGRNASGKGEIASYLASKGLESHSLSDAIRDEATSRGMEHSRENLIAMGNELRQEHGPGVLGRKIAEKIKGDAVVDSIRNPSEIEELKKLKGFTLLGVDAPIETRFERAQERGRSENATTLDEFREMEEKENSTDAAAQQLNACFEEADILIENDGSIKDLHTNIDKIIERLKGDADE
ncbi:MAG: AAA family ATPase [archaeon]